MSRGFSDQILPHRMRQRKDFFKKADWVLESLRTVDGAKTLEATLGGMCIAAQLFRIITEKEAADYGERAYEIMEAREDTPKTFEGVCRMCEKTFTAGIPSHWCDDCHNAG